MVPVAERLLPAHLLLAHLLPALLRLAQVPRAHLRLVHLRLQPVPPVLVVAVRAHPALAAAVLVADEA